MAKKAAKERSGKKDTDQFIVRMPPGMRDTFAKLAEDHGRSMNAEVVTALAAYIAQDGEPDQKTIKSSFEYVRRELAFLREQIGAARPQIDTADQDAVRKSAPPLGLKENK
jgi:hypothetical protein